MADIRHYTEGVQVHPTDLRGLKITMDWLNRKAEADISIDRLSFNGAQGAKLRAKFLSGKNGGTGVYEGVEHRVEAGPIGDPSSVFECYLDFTDKPKFFDECGIEVSLKKKQNIEWLTKVADSFSYRYLESIDVVKQTDFTDVPYVINYIPDGTQLIMLAISTYVLTKELIQNIQSLSDRISDLTDAAVPVTGVSVGFGGGVVTAYDIGNIIMAALKLIAQIAYLAAIVFAMVELTKQIIEELMPPKRFHKAIEVNLLFLRACEFLNLKLESTLLSNLTGPNKFVIMPRKNHRGGERPTGADSSFRETGVPTANSVLDTFAGVIRTFKAYFNADFKIVDGTFFFERKDLFRVQSSFVIPDTLTNQEKKINENGFNTDEMRANYNINYRYDIQDQNTLDNVNGLAFQSVISPKNTTNADLTNLKGIEKVDIPFALPLRKNKLTAIEEIVKVFATLADAITGQLGNPQSFSGKINARVGAMHLSSHFTSVPKIIVMNGGNLAKDQRNILSAERLWNEFHFINSFAPIEVNGVVHHNQYKLFEKQKIPFCFEDFVSLLGNNLVTTKDGQNAELELLEWETWQNIATISYRVNEIYDENFEITIL